MVKIWLPTVSSLLPAPHCELIGFHGHPSSLATSSSPPCVSFRASRGPLHSHKTSKFVRIHPSLYSAANMSNDISPEFQGPCGHSGGCFPRSNCPARRRRLTAWSRPLRTTGLPPTGRAARNRARSPSTRLLTPTAPTFWRSPSSC